MLLYLKIYIYIFYYKKLKLIIINTYIKSLFLIYFNKNYFFKTYQHPGEY